MRVPRRASRLGARCWPVDPRARRCGREKKKKIPMLAACAAAVMYMSDTPAVAPSPLFRGMPHLFRPLRLGEHPVMLMYAHPQGSGTQVEGCWQSSAPPPSGTRRLAAQEGEAWGDENSFGSGACAWATPQRQRQTALPACDLWTGKSWWTGTGATWAHRPVRWQQAATVAVTPARGQGDPGMQVGHAYADYRHSTTPSLTTEHNTHDHPVLRLRGHADI